MFTRPLEKCTSSPSASPLKQLLCHNGCSPGPPGCAQQWQAGILQHQNHTNLPLAALLSRMVGKHTKKTSLDVQSKEHTEPDVLFCLWLPHAFPGLGCTTHQFLKHRLLSNACRQPCVQPWENYRDQLLQIYPLCQPGLCTHFSPLASS